MSDNCSDAASGDPPSPTSSIAPSAGPHTPPRTPSPDQSRRNTSTRPSDDVSQLEVVGNINLGPLFPLFQPNDASPLGKKSYHDSIHFASIQTPNVVKKRRDIRLSMSNKIVLLPLDKFMEKFVPAPVGEAEPLDRFMAADFSAIPHKVEFEMYEPLTKAFNEDWLLPRDVAVSTPNKGDGDVVSKQKIDGGLYPRHDAPPDCTRWSLIELSIECKTESTQQDPLDDDSASPAAEAATRKDVLGQIMCYSVLVFDNQHRTHHFTLLILGPMARIIRWDRSGLLATNKFDYTKHPEYLARFLWRFGRMTPEQRGHDPTAQRVLPGSDHYKLMQARAETVRRTEDGTVVDEHARQIFKDSLFIKSSPQEDGKPLVNLRPAPLWRLTVVDSGRPREFLVGLPHTTAGTLAGRGTRTYVAVDLAHPDGPFVYLKDAWRVDHKGIEQEGKILTLLNDDSGGGPVQGVPTLVCHGDVGDQVTRAQKTWLDKHPNVKPDDCPLKTHRHYRLVVQEVCRPVREFGSFVVLIGVIYDCIEAHENAYRRKGLLHRDISAGNVLILPKLVSAGDETIEMSVGILADWELAKEVDESKTERAPCQPDRTGTWQFTSAMALDNPKKRIVVQDDMESFFHLMLYYAIRFLPHNCANVGEFMDQYFDGHHQENGVYYGGDKKMNAMTSGKLTIFGQHMLEFYTAEKDVQPKANRASLQGDGSAVPWVNPRSSLNAEITDHAAAPTTQGANDSPELHPINSVFHDFLERIKAHYALYCTAREAKKEQPPPPPTRPPPMTSTQALLRLRMAPVLKEARAKPSEPKQVTPEPALLEAERQALEG
ncbi:hypothetical protein NUW54_g5770 [Trametes sanguinea]|uniref:Uncharacterized protein n=1 Tax=Trametes sanguinea TaxID=158606 RepID=A0ACC1PWV7_9APHY|nr:hypothetical protein NUW54_g5770 [Trametes sanguinea]